MRVYIGYDDVATLHLSDDPAMVEDSASDYDLPADFIDSFLRAEQQFRSVQLRVVQHLGFDSLRAFQDARMVRLQAAIDQDRAEARTESP